MDINKFLGKTYVHRFNSRLFLHTENTKGFLTTNQRIYCKLVDRNSMQAITTTMSYGDLVLKFKEIDRNTYRLLYATK